MTIAFYFFFFMNLKNLIGHELRRVSFTLFMDEKYYLLFSVIEELLPDMQDYEDPRFSKFVCLRAKHSKKGSKDKVYFSVDRFVLTQDFLDCPSKNFVLNDVHKTRVICSDSMKLSPDSMENYWVDDSFKESHLSKCLPRRKESRFLNAWIDTSHALQEVVTQDSDFMKQYAQLSTDEYGVNLAEYPEFIGNIYLVRYNPYFRSLRCSLSVSPPGLYVSLQPRIPNKQLAVQFVNRNFSGLFEYTVDGVLDTSRSDFFFNLPDVPESVNVLVKDEKGRLLYGASDMSFVTTFPVSVGIESKKVKLTHEDGSSETVSKFVTDNFTVGSRKQKVMSTISTTQAFKILEESLEFTFFNGSTDTVEKERNRERAAEYIKRILARASKTCMIADPYFNLNDLSHFVYTMPQTDLEIRILGATEFLTSKYEDKKTAQEHKKEALRIDKSLKDFHSKVKGEEILFRLLRGKCPLHDRYIVADGMVWLLGTSFNEIGSRACTIVKLPHDTCRHITALLDSWWSDADKSISVEEYATAP